VVRRDLSKKEGSVGGKMGQGREGGRRKGGRGGRLVDGEVVGRDLGEEEGDCARG